MSFDHINYFCHFEARFKDTMAFAEKKIPILHKQVIDCRTCHGSNALIHYHSTITFSNPHRLLLNSYPLAAVHQHHLRSYVGLLGNATIYQDWLEIGLFSSQWYPAKSGPSMKSTEEVASGEGTHYLPLLQPPPPVNVFGIPPP